jgi:hypothetical protein
LFFGILIFNEIVIMPWFKKETRFERIGSPYASPGGRAAARRDMMADLEPIIEEEEEVVLGKRQTARLGPRESVKNNIN